MEMEIISIDHGEVGKGLSGAVQRFLHGKSLMTAVGIVRVQNVGNRLQKREIEL